LAIDDHSLPLKRHLCYYLSKPTPRIEPVMTPSRDDPNAPDYLATQFYGTVLYDQDRYRMWHYAINPGEKPGQLHEGPICYAESLDGLRWTKPNLGQVLFNGSRDNNAIDLPDDSTEGAFVIRDENDPDPGRLYKMVYEARPPNRPWYSVRTATSFDGLHWSPGPVLPIDDGLEPCSFYRHNGLYIVNAQFAPRGVSEGGHRAGRQGHVWISTDFDRWLQESVASFALPEPADPSLRGLGGAYDQVHLGTAACSYGNALVGLYCIWHSRPGPGDWFGKSTTSGDLGLVVSNDGMHFREPVKGHTYLSAAEDPVTPAPGHDFPTVLCQANGFLNVGDETRIYHGRWRNAPDINPSIAMDAAKQNQARQHLYYGEVALATLPRDRWGALGLFPDQAEGSVWSCPVRLPERGCQVLLNAEDAHAMRVEVSGERFALLPAYSGEECGQAQESGFEAVVNWPAGSLAALEGQTVRFRFHLARSRSAEPRLYAVYLKPLHGE
jgi:hypothetical protein